MRNWTKNTGRTALLATGFVVIGVGMGSVTAAAGTASPLDASIAGKAEACGRADLLPEAAKKWCAGIGTAEGNAAPRPATKKADQGTSEETGLVKDVTGTLGDSEPKAQDDGAPSSERKRTDAPSSERKRTDAPAPTEDVPGADTSQAAMDLFGAMAFPPSPKKEGTTPRSEGEAAPFSVDKAWADLIKSASAEASGKQEGQAPQNQQNAQGAPSDAQGAPANAQGAPADAQGAPVHHAQANAQGAPADAQGAPANAQGAPSDAQGAPSDAQGALSGAPTGRR